MFLLSFKKQSKYKIAMENPKYLLMSPLLIIL